LPAKRPAPIRLAVPEDLMRVRDIERASGQRFREYGLDDVADDEPMSVEALRTYCDAGRAWVAVRDSDQPVGYILVDLIDGGAHIEQVSVEPEHQGRGVGRALIDRVGAWATVEGLAALTLTTFRDVPWNQPLYEHLGFRVLSEGEISPGVRQLRQLEAEHGLDPELRVVMRRELSVEL
jgi:GNAT superfamily N-acetyltransferase